MQTEDLIRQQESLQNRISDVIVEISAMAADYRRGNGALVRNFRAAVAKSEECLRQIDDMVIRCLQCAAADSAAQETLVEMVVSARPRLECALAELRDAERHPGARDEAQSERDFDRMAGGRAREILTEICLETQRLSDMRAQRPRPPPPAAQHSDTSLSAAIEALSSNAVPPKRYERTAPQQLPTGFLDAEEEEEDEAELPARDYSSDYAFPTAQSGESGAVDESALEKDLLNSFLGIAGTNNGREEEEEEYESDGATQ